MNTYDKLLISTENEPITIVEKSFESKAKGLCKNNKIGINQSVKTNKEKACILAEELGHYYTTVGNILDQSKVENVKQEKKARNWGYEKLVGIVDLINAYRYGVRNKFELAEYLDVTEEFLEGVINHYKEKHGLYYEIDRYIIYFEPLGVFEVR